MIALRSLPIGSVGPNPGQPRKAFERAALAELSDSIRAVGVLEPIVVRPFPPVDESRIGFDPDWMIVAGERRWRAARDAGLTDIPAIVRDDLDDRSAFELSMIENVIRADMNPLEEADGYQVLIDQGLSIETISERIGKTASAIKSRLRLLALAPAIRSLLISGQLDSWTAGHMTKLSHESQFKVIKAMSEGRLNRGDNNAADRLCSALAEIEARVDMFTDDFMSASEPTSPWVIPTIGLEAAATRRLTADLVTAIASLEAVSAAIDAGALPPSDSPALSEQLTKATAQALRLIRRAEAFRLASEL